MAKTPTKSSKTPSKGTKTSGFNAPVKGTVEKASDYKMVNGLLVKKSK